MRLPDSLGFRGKTLWDWLQLLIVPAILIGVTFAWSATQARSDNKREDRRSQDTTLQAYLDQMSGLMLDKKLLTSNLGDGVRAVARTPTFTALRRLDGERKVEVFQFLTEAGLIADGKDGALVDLQEADLTDLDLRLSPLTYVDLSGANLSGANLSGADLRGAYLEAVNFSGAVLTDAKLGGADLLRADLTGVGVSTLTKFEANASAWRATTATPSDRAARRDRTSTPNLARSAIPSPLRRPHARAGRSSRTR